MTFPKDRNEQRLLAPLGVEVGEVLGRSGTIVYMPECDRLTYARDRTLVEHAVKEMARPVPQPRSMTSDVAVRSI
jgi:hypothetical protein